MPSRKLILGTAGHIDHGKTALVRALTGTDTDRLPQEKERGITIDIGFAELDLGAHDVGIVDVPGHERFIKNMLAGASGIDIALLVIAADDSVMPQTREHLAILELLGVRHGLIALTKTDLAETGWLDLVEEDVRTLVAGTFLADAPIVRTSATTGAGLDALRTALGAACASVERRARDEAFRLAVDRVFAQPGVGTIVTGTVSSGRLTAEDRVALLPDDRVVRVRALQTHDREAEAVERGQRAAVNLIGVHHSEVRRGKEIATPGYLRPTKLMTVHVRVLEESPRPLRHRARLRLHIGTQEVMTSLSLLDGTAVEPGSSAYAQLALAEAAVAIGGQAFVLRTESPLVTIGGGHVLQPSARRIRRRDEATKAVLPELHAADDETRVAATLRLCGGREWTTLELSRDTGVPGGELEAIVDRLRTSKVLIALPAPGGRTLWCHRDVVTDAETRIVAAIRKLHEADPLETTIPRARLANRLKHLDEIGLFGAILDTMIGEGRLGGDERAVAVAGFAPKLTGAQAQAVAVVVEAFQSGAFSPPATNDLVKRLRVSESDLRKLLDLCVERGDLVHLGGPSYLHREAESELRRRVAAALSNGGRTAGELKETLGTSRKYALPMLEYLDRVGVTKRVDDLRVLAGSSSG